MVKGLITTKDAKEELGISQARVIALIRAGRLPAEKVGGIWLIKEDDLGLVKDRKPGRPPKVYNQNDDRD